MRGMAGGPCGCFGRAPTSGPARSAAPSARRRLRACSRSSPRRSPDRRVARGRARRRAARRSSRSPSCARARARGRRLRLRARPALRAGDRGMRDRRSARRTALIERFAPSARFAVAVFSSEGCPMCQALEPAVDRSARDPLLPSSLRRARDADVWADARHPRQPVRDRARRATGPSSRRAPSTASRQLESLVATAERRRGAAAREPAPVPTPSPAHLARGFLARVGGAVMARRRATTVGSSSRGEAEAYHFCGHIYTTDSLPPPAGIPRVDQGLPAASPRRQAGRRPRPPRRPQGDAGRRGGPRPARSRRPLLPPAPRTRSATAVPEPTASTPQVDGSWYRCCGGKVRRSWIAAATASTRINGDAALPGYCYAGRKVFCVMYFQTQVPC